MMAADTLKESTYVYEMGDSKVTIKLSPEYSPSSNVSSIKVVPRDPKNKGPLSLAEIQEAVQGAFDSAQRSITTQGMDPQQTRLPTDSETETAVAIKIKKPIGKINTDGIGVRMDEMAYFLNGDLDLKDPDVDARVRALSGEELDFIRGSDDRESPAPKLIAAIKAEKKRRAAVNVNAKAESLKKEAA